jgi:HlyD family secretion protein
MKNWIIIGLLVAVAAFWIKGGKTGDHAESGTSQLETRKKTGTAERHDIRLKVTVAGEIGPAEMVSVRPEVNGKISELPVDIGDGVKKGDLLFSLDDKDLRIERESKQAVIKDAEIQLKQAESEFQRAGELFDEELISKEVYEKAGTNHELAKNAVEKSGKELALAEDRLSKTRILAPFDCTVLTRPVSVGQAVSGSGGFNSGTEVLSIADLSEMIITAHVNQADVIRLKKNMKVNIAVEAIAGLTVGGIVERIAPQSTIVNRTKGYAARILLKAVDSRIVPGMTANISIPVSSADQVLSVPLAAVFTEYNQEKEKQERYVYILQGEKFLKRLVGIGISDYFHAEILDGLQGGETVSLEEPESSLIISDPQAVVDSKPNITSRPLASGS